MPEFNQCIVGLILPLVLSPLIISSHRQPWVRSSSAQEQRTDPRSQSSTPTDTDVNPEAVSALLRQEFGPALQLATERKAFLLIGDFNGDGIQDRAIVVKPTGQPQDLAAEVRLVNLRQPDQETIRPDSQTWTDSGMSLAIVQGKGAGAEAAPPVTKFLLFNIQWVGWNSFNDELSLLPKRSQLKDPSGYVKLPDHDSVRLPADVKGDVLVIPTAAGINVALYWDGGRYRLYIDPDAIP